jgi:phosphoglucomutase
MDSFAKFKYWLESDYFDEETKSELRSIENNPQEIEDRFYNELEFGTAGLRGIMGAGTDRMNKYTVRKASQGFADYILKTGGENNEKSIVIAYDSRHKSSEFAFEAARVFAGNNIKAYLFDELKPTPELSFAVRYLKADGGIVITASHNPKEYNGYKAYGPDGAQLSPEESDKVIREVKRLKDIAGINIAKREEALEKGLIAFIGEKIDDAYIKSLKSLSVNSGLLGDIAKDFKIVYTPLCGTGNKLVRRILKETGFENVFVVPEQEMPDPEFTSAEYPNPENREAFLLALKLADNKNADIIIATDPDCDRTGIMVRNRKGEYVRLTGNQVGCLLMEYILSQKKAKGKLLGNEFIVKTIVTTEMARAIADYYSVEMVEVLTGFKFIGEKIQELDEFGSKEFLFGFEESMGYLAGTYARDKDGVVTSMLAAEMAAYYKAKGMTLSDVLEEMYERYGYTVEETVSYALEGRKGKESIIRAMEELRKKDAEEFGGCRVFAVRDYQERTRYDMVSGEKTMLDLPEANVLYFEMGKGIWVCIRPSGTEPKIKLYFGVSAESIDKAEELLKNIKEGVLAKIKRHLNNGN